MVVDADMLFRVLSVLVSAGAFLFTWSQAKNKAGAEALKDLEAKLGSVRAETEAKIAQLRGETATASQRCSELEGELKHMPDKETVHRIELHMKDMQAQIGAQGEALKSYTATMQRLEEFLLHAQPMRQVSARRK